MHRLRNKLHRGATLHLLLGRATGSCHCRVVASAACVYHAHLGLVGRIRGPYQLDDILKRLIRRHAQHHAEKLQGAGTHLRRIVEVDKRQRTLAHLAFLLPGLDDLTDALGALVKVVLDCLAELHKDLHAGAEVVVVGGVKAWAGRGCGRCWSEARAAAAAVIVVAVVEEGDVEEADGEDG